MIVTLLSTLLGFGTSALPKFFELIQDKRDKAHELEMLRVQAELQAKQADADLEKTILGAVSAQNVEVQKSYQRDIKSNADIGNSKILAFSASVRPVITYAFFLLYALVKCGQFYLLLHPALPWQEPANYAQAIVGIWGEEDMGLFAAVISFWFGDRMLRRR